MCFVLNFNLKRLVKEDQTRCLFDSTLFQCTWSLCGSMLILSFSPIGSETFLFPSTCSETGKTFVSITVLSTWDVSDAVFIWSLALGYYLRSGDILMLGLKRSRHGRKGGRQNKHRIYIPRPLSSWDLTSRQNNTSILSLLFSSSRKLLSDSVPRERVYLSLKITVTKVP
jgi:hypothetical protein